MKKILFYLIAAILSFLPISLHTSSFSTFCKNLSFTHALFPDRDEVPKPDQIALDIIDETSELLKKKYGINPCGIGMSGKFEHLSIDFKVYRSLSKEQARMILVDCVGIFLSQINHCAQIRPHLKPYPFTNKNVGITLFISEPGDKSIYHPAISVASWSSEGVHFRTLDPDKFFGYKEKQNETHAEALALAAQYEVELAQSSVQPSDK